MTAPIVTCALVAALCLALGHFIVAAVVVCGFCLVFEFFLPSVGKGEAEFEIGPDDS